MMKKVMTRGLFVLLAVALLGACSTATPEVRYPQVVPCSTTEPCAPPEDDPNPCRWSQDYMCTTLPPEGMPSEEMPAIQMLGQILHWANLAEENGRIEAHDLGRIRCRVPECQLSTLANELGVHVCLVNDPEARELLPEIHRRAREAHEAPGTLDTGDPQEVVARGEEAIGRWHTVATDLDSFPSRAPVQPPQ